MAVFYGDDAVCFCAVVVAVAVDDAVAAAAAVGNATNVDPAADADARDDGADPMRRGTEEYPAQRDCHREDERTAK